MSGKLQLKLWAMFRPSPGAPAAIGTWACQKAESKEICKSCILFKPGYEVLGVTAVHLDQKADPGSEKAGQKTWSRIPVCCHVEERVNVDLVQAPAAILRLLDSSFEEGLKLANPDQSE